MSEKNRRQLTRMQRQLEDYGLRQLPLQALIGDLEFLLSNVDSADEKWRQQFLSKIGVLEDTYAVALDKKAGVLDATDHQLLSIALGAIENLIRDELARLPGVEDAD